MFQQGPSGGSSGSGRAAVPPHKAIATPSAHLDVTADTHLAEGGAQLKATLLGAAARILLGPAVKLGVWLGATELQADRRSRTTHNLGQSAAPACMGGHCCTAGSTAAPTHQIVALGAGSVRVNLLVGLPCHSDTPDSPAAPSMQSSTCAVRAAAGGVPPVPVQRAAARMAVQRQAALQAGAQRQQVGGARCQIVGVSLAYQIPRAPRSAHLRPL